jgi:acid phosphatase (class A)
MAGVAAAVARRTPAEAALAARDAEDETGAYFASAIGPGFDLAKLPKTRQLLDDIGETEEVVAKAAKAFFHRERPYAVAPQLATCTPHKPGAAPSSYPSGHATRSFSMGIVLAELLPAKAQAILTRAAAYAENRVVCGVHFPSDIVAGQALGTAIAESLPQSAAFRMEFDAAKAELTAAGL